MLDFSRAIGVNFYEQLYKNAVEIPIDVLRRISKAARDNDIYVCVSGSELDGGTLYLTQFWFDDKGNMMGKHRKLKPTCVERTIWGDGDGGLTQVFPTEIGRLGGLMCWEHIVPLNIAAMNSLNEQIHISAWPSFAPQEGNLISPECCELVARYYPLATHTFTLMTTQFYSQEMMDMLCENDYQRSLMAIGRGNTVIFGPNGLTISEKIPHDKEGIAYAELDFRTVNLL